MGGVLRKVLRLLYGCYAALAFVVVVLLLCCPVLIVAPGLSLRRRIGRFTVRAWLATIFVPLRVRGLQHLPAGACVVVSNHASYVDGIVLTSVLPTSFTFLVQHEVHDWPYVGLIIRRMGVAFVNRHAVMPAALAVRRLIRRVAAGESVAIFPEGTFRAAPGVVGFYGGAFTVAATAGVPVLPAVMRGTRRLLPDGKLLPQRSVIEIEFFAPLSSSGNSRHAAELLGAEARALIVRHSGEGDGALPVAPDRHAALNR